MNDSGRRALHWLLWVASLAMAVRLAAAGPELGPPHQAERCAVPVESKGNGVVCVASPTELHAGDRFAGDGAHDRMAPARLALLRVAVDVNRASEEELASLPNVGAVTAARIAQGRPYGRIEDLLHVPGIGARRLEVLRDRVFVGEKQED